MDHLSKPQYARDSRIDIPYLCGDDLKFSTMKARKQWPMGTPETSDGPRDMKKASLIQKELYFGMLFEFFAAADVELDEIRFRRVDRSHVFTTTACLPDYLLQWVKNFENFPADERKDRGQRVEDCLTFYQLHSQDFTMEGALGDQIYNEVGISVLVLGSTLTFCRQVTFVTNPPREWKSNLNHKSWGPSRVLIERLLATGWCPSEVQLASHHSYSTPS